MTPGLRAQWGRERATQWRRVQDRQAALWETLMRPVEMDVECKAVLYENLWELYGDDERGV